MKAIAQQGTGKKGSRRRHVADNGVVSDHLRVRVVHVAPKATAKEIRRDLGISKATAKRAQKLVETVRGAK